MMKHPALTSSKQALPPSSPVAGGILQRKCACGQHTHGGECEGCKKERMSLQRRSEHGGELDSVPPIVHEVLRSPGQPLDAETRAFFEPRFGHDFSQVHVQSDASSPEVDEREVNTSSSELEPEIEPETPEAN